MNEHLGLLGRWLSDLILSLLFPVLKQSYRGFERLFCHLTGIEVQSWDLSLTFGCRVCLLTNNRASKYLFLAPFFFSNQDFVILSSGLNGRGHFLEEDACMRKPVYPIMQFSLADSAQNLLLLLHLPTTI